MASECARCGAKIGMAGRLRGAELCGDCQDRLQAEQAAQREAADARAGHVRQLISGYLEDELLTADEEHALVLAAQQGGMSEPEFRATLATFGDRLLIARFNAGRIAPQPTATLLRKAGEQVALEVEAQLLKEVVEREIQGGSSGFSFRIAKGVTYRTGQFRGHSVVVGSHLAVADSGTLTVTTQRVVFQGLRQTGDVDLKRLVGFQVFDDGIQLHITNRKTAPLYKVADGHVVGAAVNAVSQLRG